MLRYTWLSIGLTLSLALILALGNPPAVQAMGGCGGGDHRAMTGSGHMGGYAGGQGMHGSGYDHHPEHHTGTGGTVYSSPAPQGSWVPSPGVPPGPQQVPPGQQDHSGHQHN